MRTAKTTWSRRFWSGSGYKLERAKTNIGLGRITNAPEESSQKGSQFRRSGNAMTNTLHRFGDAESFRDDYVVFAISSRGKNDEGSVPKLKKFLEMALPFKPVNLGDRAPRRRAAPARGHESDLALESRHDAGFPRA